MVYNIDGTEYVLIKVPLDAESTMDEIQKSVRKYGAILQDWEFAYRSLFFGAKIKVSLLVPSKNLKEFNERLYK